MPASWRPFEFKMSSAAFLSHRSVRNFGVFLRKFCSKSSEFDLGFNFKYPTRKLIRNERGNDWKNRRNDGQKSDFRRHAAYENRDREVQNWRNESSRAETTLDHQIPEKYDKDAVVVSQDLMEAERERVPGNKSRSFKRAPDVLGPIPRYSDSGVRSRVVGEIVFGISPVSMALKVKRRSFHQLFVKPHSDDNPRISAIKSLAKKMKVPVVTIGGDKLDEMSEGRPHQGVCLDAGKLFFEVNDWNGRPDANAEPLCIFMDKIQDPMNLGAVLRSCYYFGVKTVFTVKRKTCKLTPVVSKASSGAMEMINVHAVEQPDVFLKQKIKEGWNVIGSASADALDRDNISPANIADVNKFIWPKPTILLVGNEGGGIDKELIKFCDRIVTISNCDSGSADMMSLNVSVATGIILHLCCSQLLKNSTSCLPDEAVSIKAAE